MKITPQCVVSLTWVMKDTLGEVLDELDEPVEFLLGGQDLLAKIEESLQGHEPGAKIDLLIMIAVGFGLSEALTISGGARMSSEF